MWGLGGIRSLELGHIQSSEENESIHSGDLWGPCLVANYVQNSVVVIKGGRSCSSTILKHKRV